MLTRRSIRYLSFTVLLLASAATADTIPPRPSVGCGLDHVDTGRRLAEHIEVGGRAREYILDVPDSVRPHAPAPLLLDFHGFGHSGAGVWNVSRLPRSRRRRRDSSRSIRRACRSAAPARHEQEGAGLGDVHASTAIATSPSCARCSTISSAATASTAPVSSPPASPTARSSALCSAARCRIASRPSRRSAAARCSVACTPGRGVPILIQHGRQDRSFPIDRARAARDDWLKIDRCTAEKSADGPSCERWTTCRPGAVVEYCEERLRPRLAAAGDTAHMGLSAGASVSKTVTRISPSRGRPRLSVQSV